MTNKTYLVIADHSAVPIDGKFPFVPASRIIKAFGLRPRDCLTVLAREYQLIALSREAGLKVLGVKEYANLTIERTRMYCS